MTPGPEDDVSQDEKRRIIRNQSRNGDTGTFLSHTHIDDAGGRFAAVNAATIVGQDPQVKYPQLPSSSRWHGSDPVPDEPPLGYRVDEMPPLEPSAASVQPVEQLGGAPSSAPLDVAAPPPSSRGSDNDAA
jgi:hypothetical protein